jgi:hypothetical protein
VWEAARTPSYQTSPGKASTASLSTPEWQRPLRESNEKCLVSARQQLTAVCGSRGGHCNVGAVESPSRGKSRRCTQSSTVRWGGEKGRRTILHEKVVRVKIKAASGTLVQLQVELEPHRQCSQTKDGRKSNQPHSGTVCMCQCVRPRCRRCQAERRGTVVLVRTHPRCTVYRISYPKTTASIVYAAKRTENDTYL